MFQHILLRFPWLDLSDIELGCLGLEKEGWFDPHSLLTLLRQGAIEKGTTYVKGEAVEFKFDEPEDLIIAGITRETHQTINSVVVSIKRKMYLYLKRFSSNRLLMSFSIKI